MQGKLASQKLKPSLNVNFRLQRNERTEGKLRIE
jgi:hypothetical protein